MGGALLALVATGIQNRPLNSDPERTFWKSVMKRYSHFAEEPMDNAFSGSVNFGKSSCSSVINRNGDLVNKLYLRCRVSLSRTSSSGQMAFVKRLGTAMIKEVKASIGGQVIEKLTGQWMDVNYELSRNQLTEDSLDIMLGDTEDLTVLSEHDREATLYIPLPFWFTQSSGSACPLISLQYHELRIDCSFEDSQKLVVCTADCGVRAEISDAQLVTGYVFLDSVERKMMATSSHEYVIKQTQAPGADTLSERTKKYRLTFNHPTSYLVWCARLGKYNTSQRYLAYHPEDMQFVKKRTAEMLYLLALDVTENAGVFSVTSSDETGHGYVLKAQSSSMLQRVVDQLKHSVVLVTKADGTFGSDNTELPGNFLDQPFSFVEFVDSSWEKVIMRELISTPADQLGLDTSHPFWASLSQHFVSVNMPNNFGVYFDRSENPTEEATIQLNGQDRMAVREGMYFNHVVSI